MSDLQVYINNCAGNIFNDADFLNTSKMATFSLSIL